MLQTYHAENQLEKPQSERIAVERDRHKPRICNHYQEAKAAILRPHDQSTESVHTFSKVCWMAQGAEEDLEDDGTTTSVTGQARIWRSARHYSKRQREIEGAGVSFLGLRPSAMKMEKDKLRHRT